MEERTSGLTDVAAGLGVVIVHPSNLYGCSLGDDVFVGPFSEIQRGVRVGARTRIQSHSFVCEGTFIGDDCFIGHGVMFTNDRFRGGPARGDRSKYESTLICDRVYIGSNVTLLPVYVCSDTIIGAGSVVTQDIREPGTYVGNPARLVDRSGQSTNP